MHPLRAHRLQVYEKIFPVPLRVVTAYFFSGKTSFFDELRPEGEIVKDLGQWKVEEDNNKAVRVALFDTRKQGFTINVTQYQDVRWVGERYVNQRSTNLSDTRSRSLVFRCDHHLRGFPGAQNMLMSSLWCIAAQGGSTHIAVHGVVNYVGFFLGKDKVRRESLDSIADACQKTEDKLTLLLGLKPEAAHNESKGLSRVQNIQRIMKAVDLNRALFLDGLQKLGAPANLNSISLLVLVSLGLQIIVFLVLSTKA